MTIAFQQCTNKVTADLLITNVNLIDGTGAAMQEDMTIIVRHGRITHVSRSIVEGKYSAKEILDGRGKYLMPGLIDGHAHPNPIETTLAQFIQFGVTTIMVPGCSICDDAYFTEMRRRAEIDTIPAPRVYHTSHHFTMEGRHPVKTYPTPNWQHEKTVYFLKDTLDIEKYVAAEAKKPILGIKVTIEDGPAPPFVERMPQSFINKLVKEAQKFDLEIFGHISDNIEWEMADRAGVQNLIHFVAVDIDFDRDAQMVQRLLDDQVSWVSTLMLDKSFMYPLHPEWYQNEMIQKYYDASLISEWTSDERKELAELNLTILERDYGIKNPTLENVSIPLAEDLFQLYKMGINVVLGTDTGNTFILPGYSMHEEMQLIEKGGAPTMDIIRMATLNAAKMLHAEGEIGSIEIGKKADMILLEKDPTESIANTLAINLVIKNGVIQKRMD